MVTVMLTGHHVLMTGEAPVTSVFFLVAILSHGLLPSNVWFRRVAQNQNFNVLFHSQQS